MHRRSGLEKIFVGLIISIVLTRFSACLNPYFDNSTELSCPANIPLTFADD